MAVSSHDSVNSSTSVCITSEGGRVIAFDLSMFSFSAVGEFILVNSSLLEVQMRQIPCDKNTVCINGLGIIFEDIELSIHAPYEKHLAPEIYVNSRRIVLGRSHPSILQARNVSITQVSANKYAIYVSHNIIIKAIIFGRYMTLELVVSTSFCKVLQGLCGSCAKLLPSENVTGPNNQTTFKPLTVLRGVEYSNLTNGTLDQFIKEKLSVKPFKHVIVLDGVKRQETRVVYGGGYSLFFRFTAVISYNAATVFASNAITIQLLVRSCDPTLCGGTILSYASRLTIYITNFITLKCVVGTSIYDTGFSTERNKWNGISIVFMRKERRLSVYLVTSAGFVRVKNFRDVEDPFAYHGSLAIGLWQPSSGTMNLQSTHTFVGDIDEIRVWSVPFDYALVKESWLSNIQVGIPSLSALWKLNEGEGFKVKDLVSRTNLAMPQYPMKDPIWHFSDAPLAIVPFVNPNESNETLKATARNLCFSLLYKGPIFNACSGLQNVTLEFYFRACIETVVTSGNTVNSLDIVIAVSDYCQTLFDLDFWPAQPLCNDFSGRRFPNWIGNNCTIPCIFGGSSETDKNTCICDKGFFGNNCSQVCPGGAENICNKHGICEVSSGKCRCEINWRGDQNCTLCSEGWIGDDCSLSLSKHVKLDKVTAIGSVNIGGIFTTFSGVSFILRATGEYYLIRSVYVNVVFQVRLVSCYGEITCINAIALLASSQTLVIHGPYTSKGHVVLWLNGDRLNFHLNPITQKLHGFDFVELYHGHYKIYLPNLEVTVRVSGRYLILTTLASGDICKDSIGLLGACNKKILDSLLSYSQVTNCSESVFIHNNSYAPITSMPVNETEDAIIKLSENLRILACHSLFEYKYKDIVEYREANAGYNLFFNRTAVVSADFNDSFLGNDLTLDLMFKTVHFGVVVSYTKIQTFFISNAGGKFSIYAGDLVFHTNITAEVNRWNQIIVVFEKLSAVLHFYHFRSNGLLQRVDIEIGSHVFTPGGTFSFAGWQPSLDGSGPQPLEVFVGFMDEIRIWNQAFHPAIILQMWKRSVEVSAKTLLHLWNFNEGEGEQVIDKISRAKLVFGTKPWRSPAWHLSEVTLKDPFYKKKVTEKLENATLQTKAEEFCRQVLLAGPLYDSCKYLGRGVATFYYRSCIRRIAITGSIYMSLEVIVGFADYCQLSLNLTDWPARLLCNEFLGRPFPIWYGPDCNKKCVNGKIFESNNCICHQGYWGKHCSYICPGGSLAPCYNHGLCDSATGLCHCKANWNGTRNCRLPSPGWLGLDSSVAIVSLPPSKTLYAVSTQGGHYVTFDGVSYTLVAVGVFYLIHMPEKGFSLQVRHVPCHLQSVCVNAIAFSVASTIVSFHAPYESNMYPVIWVDNMLVEITGSQETLGPSYLGISFWHQSRHQYVIDWLNHFKIIIRTEGRYLNFKVDINSTYCYGSTGLLGSCNNNADDDFANNQHQEISLVNLTQARISSSFNKSLSSGDNLLVLKYKHFHEQLVPSGGMYALLFNQTGASSVPLVKTFLNDADLTIEILFQPFRFGGTLVSYALESTFAVTIESTITISHGSLVWDTGIPIQVKVWSHLSILWHHQIKTLEVYVFSHQGKISRRSHTWNSSPFQPGGIIQLGQWDLSPEETEAKTQISFVGLIDEIRVWKRAFDPVLIQQNWKMNVLPSHPEISALWKCNEGEGNVVINLITDENILLPSKPWPQPVWVYSDAAVSENFTSAEKPFETVFSNKETEKMAFSFCFEMFYKDPLAKHCDSLSPERDFFYLVCLKDIAVSETVNAAITAVVSFSDHCQAVLSLNFWPAQKLCNRFIGISFPLWIGHKCTVKCVFGIADPNNRNYCICDNGYWGKDCSKVCPGGIIDTCGGHGRCDKATGKCICDINWQGDEACRSCTTGWGGTRCQFAITKFEAAFTYTSSIGSGGYLSTFFGVRFKFHKHGEYYLMRTATRNFIIQIRQSPCVIMENYSPLCTTGFSFSYKNLRVAIRAPIVSVLKTDILVPIIWVNEKLVRVDHVTKLSLYFTMVRVSRLTFHIIGPDSIMFSLTVGSSLGITIHVPNENCQNSSGLLGACTDYNFGANGRDIELLQKRLAENSVVPRNNSLFVHQYFSYQEHQHVTGGGFSLLFKDSLVRSTPQYFPRVNILTIELLVKIYRYGGTIFSYAREQIFALINDEKLKIVYGDKVIDTGLSNEIGKWNQISLVFKTFVGVLQLYHFNSRGSMSIRVFRLTNVVFMIGGILVFGQWQPSRDGKGKPPFSSFEGEIDEVRFWKRQTNPDLIRRSWRLNVQVQKYPGLLYLWKFNQVEGLVIRDLVSGNHLYIVRFHEPLWSFSDADIPWQNVDTIYGDLLLKVEAESYCQSLLLNGPLFVRCKVLGVQVSQFYYRMCLNDVAVSKELRSAVYSVVLYADYCQAVLTLAVWPAKELCNHFLKMRFPFWVGDQCDVRCVFGYAEPKLNASGLVTCSCEHGYWGQDCSKLCPGGLWNVCNGHGNCCPQNGTCLCEPHWRGSTQLSLNTSEYSNCSQCTIGWTGSDCSIAVEDSIRKTNKTGLAISFGDPHFTTVTGGNYHFEVPGSYHLLILQGIEAQIMQVPCNNRLTCRRITEFAVNTTTNLFSLMYEESGNVSSFVLDRVKGEFTSLHKSDSWTDVGGLTYRWVHSNILELKDKTINIRFIILLYNEAIGTAIEMPNDLLNNTFGICGKEEGDWIIDNQSQSNNNTETSSSNQARLEERIIARETVRAHNTVLKNRYSGFAFTGAGYMLIFGSHKQVVLAADNSYDLREFTFEIWICLMNEALNVVSACSAPHEQGIIQSSDVSSSSLKSKHAIVSFTYKSEGFAVLYDHGIKVSCFGHELNTALNISRGIWHHVGVTWRNTDGRVQVFVNSKGNFTTSKSAYGLGIGKLFSLNGSLQFGRYVTVVNMVIIWFGHCKSTDNEIVTDTLYSKYN